jgi:predicted RNase H-like HicB family nuclease
MYRVGFPGWKLAARWGIPVSFRVEVMRDDEVNRYWARSPDLDGLVVEAGSLDELREEVRSAAEMLFELAVNGHRANATPRLIFQDAAICPA